MSGALLLVVPSGPNGGPALSPATVVGLRTVLGALVLVPLAMHRGALRPALKAWPFVVAFWMTS